MHSCGGTVKDGVIEIQGDHRQILKTEVEKRGHQVKQYLPTLQDQLFLLQVVRVRL